MRLLASAMLFSCNRNEAIDSGWKQPRTDLPEDEWWESDTASPFSVGDQSNDNNASSNSPDPSTANPVRGEQLYAGACSSCHGGRGEGGQGPALSHLAPLLTNEQLFVSIRYRGQRMPNEIVGGVADIADVMAFLRSWEE